MEGFWVKGGECIRGSICVDSAKNAVLPILAAAILTQDAVHIEHCPGLMDVYAMESMLKMLGCACRWQGDELTIESSRLHNWEMPEDEE